MAFTFADRLKDAGKFCATICWAHPSSFFERRFIPRASDPTATVTFIECEGQTFAVTAKHVIDTFANLAANDENILGGYLLPNKNGVWINSPFVTPPATIDFREPDIAITLIPRDLPARIEKLIYKIEDIEPHFPIPYALAAGFPTTMKKDMQEPVGFRLQMHGVVAAAEGVGSSADSDQVQFYSPAKVSDVAGDTSGMSGGPVFWSDGERHGLLGFVKEAMASDVQGDGMTSVHFICQRASYSTFQRWVQFAEIEVPRQREILNRRGASRAD